MAETGGLENRIPGNRDEGSNPSPSANSTFVAFSAEGHSMSWIERFFRTFWPQVGPAFTANRVQTNHEIRSLVRLVRLPAGGSSWTSSIVTAGSQLRAPGATPGREIRCLSECAAIPGMN